MKNIDINKFVQNEKKPFFSVVTINLNNSNGLRKTIASVISQDSDDFEYIIIDGGSNDGSLDVIRDSQNRIDISVSEQDTGIYNAMNKGIGLASGEYVIFMNSGDVFASSAILSRVKKEGTTEDILYGDLMVGQVVYASPKDLTLRQLFEFALPHQALFTKRDLFKNNLYNEHDYRIISDCEWILQSYINGRSFKYLSFLISIMEENGISSDRASVMAEMKIMCRKNVSPLVYDDYLAFTEKGFSKLYTIRIHSKGFYLFLSYIIWIFEWIIRLITIRVRKKYRF